MFLIFGTILSSISFAEEGNNQEVKEVKTSVSKELNLNKNVFIILNSGEELMGKLVSEDDKHLVLISNSLGEIKVSKEKIKKVKYFDVVSTNDDTNQKFYKYDDPNNNSSFLIPTAESIETGSKYISNYELFYMNIGATPVEHLNLSIGFVFPITPGVIAESPYSFGVKYQFIDYKYNNLAFLGSVTFNTDSPIYTFGLAGNQYNNDKSIKFDMYGGGIIHDDGYSYNIGLSLSKRVSESVKLMFEYIHDSTIGTDSTANNKLHTGYIIFGVRFFGENLSFDLGGAKNIYIYINDSERDFSLNEWYILPYINFSYHF